MRRLFPGLAILHPRDFGVIAAIFIACLSLGIGYHYFLGQKVAIAVIAPPPQGGGSTLSGLGGIQSILANSGLPLSGSANLNPDFEQLIYFLNSNALARRFQSSHPDAVLRAMGKQGEPMPTAGQFAQYLGDHLLTNRVPNTIFVRVSFYDPDGAFAQDFLSKYLKLADTIVRQNKFALYTRQHALLEKRLNSVGNADIKQVLSSLQTDIQRNLLMIDSNSEYAYQIVDPAYNDPKSGKKPGWMISALIALLLASITSAAYISLCSWLRRT
jgi:hypothetical protein